MNMKATIAILVAVIATVGALTLSSDDVSADTGTVISDGTEYTSLNEAFDGAADGSTISVTSDMTVTATATVPVGKTLTLDLNGNALTSSVGTSNPYMIHVYGNLTVIDSSQDGSGTMIATGTDYLVWGEADSSIVIEEGLYYSDISSIVRSYGVVTIEGGSFNYEGSGYCIDIFGHLTVNDISIFSSGNGIRIYYDVNTGAHASGMINGGYISASSYGIVVLGGQFVEGSANDFAVLTINDVTIDALICIGTNASNGLYSNVTINVYGGEYSGYWGMYIVAYGEYNILGGHFIATGTGLQIATGIVTIGGTAIIEAHVESNTDGIHNGGPGNTDAAIMIGKASSGYINSISVNIIGGEITNNIGDAIVMYDNSMNLSAFEDDSIVLNATGGTITGDVKLKTGEDGDPEKIGIVLDGASIEGNVEADDGMNNSFEIISGVLNGNVSGVETPAPYVATLDYLGITLNFYGDGFTLPEDIPYRENYAFMGLSFYPNSTHASFLPGDYVQVSEDVTIYAVWQSTYIPIPDDDEWVPQPGNTPDSTENDDTTVIVACAAAAVVAAIMAVFLIVERRSR